MFHVQPSNELVRATVHLITTLTCGFTVQVNLVNCLDKLGEYKNSSFVEFSSANLKYRMILLCLYFRLKSIS